MSIAQPTRSPLGGVADITDLETGRRPHAGPRAEHEVRRRGVAFGVVFMTILVVPLLVLLASKVDHVVGSGRLLGLYGVMVTSVILTAVCLAFMRYQDPVTRAQAAQPGGELPTAGPLVTLLVAVKDEHRLIEACVQSMRSSTYLAREIIVIDDGSTDGTRDVLADLAAADSTLRVVSLPASVGKKRALAEGIRLARGDILVFTDSDSILAPDAVARAVAIFSHDPTVGAVSGHARALNSERNVLTKMQDTWYDGQFGVWKAVESSFGAVTCVSGPFAAFRREAVFNYIQAWAEDRFLGVEFRFATDRQLTGYVLGSREIGPRLKRKYEDSDFVTSVDYPERPWKVVYSRSIRVWTQVPDSFRRLVRQQIRWKKSFIRNLFFTGRFYWRKPLPAAIIFYTRASFRIVGPIVAANELIRLVVDDDVRSAVLYLCGIALVGGVMGAAYKLQNPESNRWVYRPLMSLLNTCVLCWLIVWSMATIWKPTWSRA